MALTYLINQEDKIREYLKDGRIEISTNSIETAIRPFTVGRSNWVFCNTPKGAAASSFYYTLVESAKANKLDVYKYIESLLERIPNIELTDENIETIMPYSTAYQKDYNIKIRNHK
ncbi:MAG: transposase [Erysipelotrichaceae bacterium]